MTQPQERRPPCITFRVLRTPAPTQLYQAWDDTSVPAPHCTPGWEAQLRLVHPPPRILRGIVLACAVQGEQVRRIEETTPRHPLLGSPWYVTTDQTRYFLHMLEQRKDVVRLGLAPVQHQRTSERATPVQGWAVEE